jgi:hypothetical protein
MIKDKFIYGLVIGLALPLLTFVILFFINMALNSTEIQLSFKFESLCLFSICVNLIPTIFANRWRYENFIRGIMFPTIIGSFVWFFYFNPLNLFV